MATGVYCMTPDEHRANAILTALRNAGFSSEISVLIGDKAVSRNMSVKEDAARGAKIGSIVGALVALTLPGIGEALIIGPLLAALTGAAAGRCGRWVGWRIGCARTHWLAGRNIEARPRGCVQR
jgi:hypothetical protein